MPIAFGSTTPRSVVRLARAYRWRRMIETGEYASITELAKGEDINQSYACQMLRLTLLAPAIVKTILDGRQNSDVMLKQLMKPLPARWDEQLTALAWRSRITNAESPDAATRPL